MNSFKQQKFMWGAATSSYQTEGGINNNDWHYFTSSNRIRKRISSLTTPSRFYRDIRHIVLEPAKNAVKFWDRKYYLKDFENAIRIGLNAIRISLEWARIQPERTMWDQGAIDNYRQMLMSMQEMGLEPIVTLNHLTLPLWVLTPPIQFKRKIYQHFLPKPLRDLPLCDPPPSDPYWTSLRGWENKQTVDEFVNFVERIVSEFKDLVDYWITINEPVATIIGGGYLAGVSPPGFFLDGKRSRAVLHNLIEAHVRAYNKITDLDDSDANNDGIAKNVGFSHLMVIVKPIIERSILKSKSANIDASENFSYFMNDYFLNAILNGEEDLNYLNTLERYNKDSNNFIVHNEWKQKTDFIGLNYYRRVHVRQSLMLSMSNAKFIGGAPISDLSKRNDFQGMLNDLGWEIYPQGLYHILTSLKKFGRPVLITENGIADKADRLRGQFIIDHLAQIRRCLDENIDVIGYLHWSLLDNYEWHEGYNQEGKFGLFYIDRNRPDLPRIITKSAEILKQIIRDSALTNSNGEVTSESISKMRKNGNHTSM